MTRGHLDSRAFARLACVHRLLAGLAAGDACSRPDTVLALGTAVLFHGILEEGWLLELNPLVDPAVVVDIGLQHQHLAEDLELLESLLTAEPASPDLEPFAQALLARLREHIARDERLLYTSRVRQQLEDHLASST